MAYAARDTRGALTMYDRISRSHGWVFWPKRAASDELIYAYQERGFALHSMRSPHHPALSAMRARRGSRQLAGRKIWDELTLRLAAARTGN